MLGTAIMMIADLVSVTAQPQWIWNNSPLIAARWLGDHGLTHGVGEYWSANLIAAMSGNRLEIGSVVPRDGKVVPYVLATDRNRFAKAPQFVVWRDENLTGLKFTDVQATYTIKRLTSVAGYRIAVLVDPEGDRTYAKVTASH